MLTYTFDNRSEDSLYGHLYQCIRRDIESGVISADEKLPSKRAFAKHLGVSLITVEGAYAQLVAEGYVRSVPRSGYFANSVARPASPPASGQRIPKQEAEPAKQEADAAASGSGEHSLVADLASGSVATGLFPFALWARTLRDVLAHEPEQELLCESPAKGSRRLREALARHLRTFRGLEADPDQIVVGSGAQTLYHLLIQLLGRDSRFAVEDPGYTRLTRVYQSNDVTLSHVPMDGSGIDVAALGASQANVVHLMPSHQYPTGLVTPINRRYELLGWATEAPGRYIIEDDYDCEFRLAGRPIPTMQSIDVDERVIYANTFSRSLGPAFRIGYLVLPTHLAERFQHDLGFYSCTVSTMEQLVLARFIENGDFERHVNRMRSHYRAVRDELVAALASSALADRIAVEGADAGLHFLLSIAAPASEAALVAAARAEGLVLAPLSAFSVRAAAPITPPDNPRRFVVSYAGIDREAIPLVVQALVRAVKAASATT